MNGTAKVAFKKKNNTVTPPSEKSNRNVSNGRVTSGGSSSGTQSCNLDFTSLAKNLKLDTPISLANCNMKIITDRNVLEGKNLLEKTCRHHNVILVLMSDNKTVANRRVEPVFENGTFTCKQTGWFTVKYINSKFGYLNEWESETKPSEVKCATTCNQISPFKSTEGTEIADGKVFPGDKQCLEVCAPQVEKICASLKDKKYGNSSVESTKAVYKVDTDNLFRYGCELYLRLTNRN